MRTCRLGRLEYATARAYRRRSEWGTRATVERRPEHFHARRMDLGRRHCRQVMLQSCRLNEQGRRLEVVDGGRLSASSPPRGFVCAHAHKGKGWQPGTSHALDFSPSISQSDCLNECFHSTSFGGSTDVSEPAPGWTPGREASVAERCRARPSHG